MKCAVDSCAYPAISSERFCRPHTFALRVKGDRGGPISVRMMIARYYREALREGGGSKVYKAEAVERAAMSRTRSRN